MAEEWMVFIVDDDDAVRHALALLMKSACIPAQNYSSAEDFLAHYQPGIKGCLLVDVRMPGMSGLELQQALSERQIDLPLIIMTGHGDIAMAVSAMKHGAYDFIEKPFNNQWLLDRVRQCLSEFTASQVNRDKQADSLKRLHGLTEREREVMDLLVEGKLNKQIALELDISVRTVEAHRAKIMKKLQANSLSDVVRIALLE